MSRPNVWTSWYLSAVSSQLPHSVLVRRLPQRMETRRVAARRTVEVEETPPREIYLPAATTAKVPLIALAGWVLYELRMVIALMLVAVVLAIAFEPVVAWLEARLTRRKAVRLSPRPSMPRTRASRLIRPVPGSAWVEVEAAAVEIDGRREILRVAEAARLPLDAHDLAVQSFGDAIRDRMLGEAEHTIKMPLEHARHLLHRIEPRAHRPAVPL